MWIWESELRALGFRRRSERYWRCERRFGLPGWGHLSIFPWSEQVLQGDEGLRLVELDTFHVTFVVDGEHVHFYYHERLENDWKPGGHTSGREIRRLGRVPRQLRAEADAVAAALVAALAGVLYPR